MALILSTSITAMATRKVPSLVPIGARWKIKEPSGQDPGRGLDGYWYAMSDHGNWGQGKCLDGGSECQLWQWVTWWFGQVISEPPDPEGVTGITYYDYQWVVMPDFN